MIELKLLGALIGMTPYIPICIGIYMGKVKQNFASWVLWTMLDAIATFAAFLQNGNYKLQAGFTIGSIAVILFLAAKTKLIWTKFETIVSLLVLICLCVWYFIGNDAGIISSVIALIIAGIPQALSTLKKPSDTPTIPFLLFSLGGLFSFLGGKEWTIKERLFSGETVIFCFLIALLSMKKSNNQS